MGNYKGKKLLLPLVIFFFGCLVGFAFSQTTWQVIVNGKSENLPVHIIKNMFFVNLEDLAKLPGWNVGIDLGGRKVSINTPNSGLEPNTVASPPAQPNMQNRIKPNTTIETGSKSSGPPDNVRMTVQAALSSLDDVQKGVDGNSTANEISGKLNNARGIVTQAINLLWTVPKTRTLQADLEVALEDMQSEVSLSLAKGEAEQGILPWTHPTAQNLMLKYPDLRPCQVTKEKLEGLDLSCGKNILSDLEADDIHDVQRDLNSYE